MAAEAGLDYWIISADRVDLHLGLRRGLPTMGRGYLH